MPRIRPSLIAVPLVGICLCMSAPHAVFGEVEPPFQEISMMIQKGQIRDAFISIREHQSRVQANREWMFRLEVLRVRGQLSLQLSLGTMKNMEYALEALETAQKYYLDMSSEEKERHKREFTLLVNDITERIYQEKYLRLYINKYSEAVTDDRGRMVTDLFWGCFHLMDDRNGQASDHFKSAGRRIEQMMKDRGEEYGQDTYFLILAGRVYTKHMQSFIRQGKIEKAKEVEKKMIETLKLSPAAMERYAAWFAAEVDKYRMQSKCRAEVTPILNRMVRLVEKGDTASLRTLLTQPTLLLDEVASRTRARQAFDLFWKITDITGDTDFRAGARITLDFTIHGTWIRQFTPKAERYELEGLHRDMTVEDIRDVIKQEYSQSQTQSHTPTFARLQAVFLFDGAGWKIEKLLEPAKTAKPQKPKPKPRSGAGF